MQRLPSQVPQCPDNSSLLPTPSATPVQLLCLSVPQASGVLSQKHLVMATIVVWPWCHAAAASLQAQHLPPMQWAHYCRVAYTFRLDWDHSPPATLCPVPRGIAVGSGAGTPVSQKHTGGGTSRQSSRVLSTGASQSKQWPMKQSGERSHVHQASAYCLICTKLRDRTGSNIPVTMPQKVPTTNTFKSPCQARVCMPLQLCRQEQRLMGGHAVPYVHQWFCRKQPSETIWF